MKKDNHDYCSMTLNTPSSYNDRNFLPSKEEILEWMRLIRTPYIGPVGFYRLVARFGGSPKKALDALQKGVLGISTPKGGWVIPSEESIEKEYKNHMESGAFVLIRKDPRYPKSLSYLNDAPPVLSVRGDVSLLERQGFAIVGARNASFPGRKWAFQIAQALSLENIVVISGLARGIDGAAHEGSLEAGTIAVLAGGIDRIYPSEHAILYENIARKGLLISEMPWGTEAVASLFPRRNRLISGLSWGILVVEGAKGSGSLSTVGYALEQGRYVFATPGHPLDRRSQGVNALLKDGAILVDCVEDILTQIPQTIVPLKNQSSGQTSYEWKDQGSDTSKVTDNTSKGYPGETLKNMNELSATTQQTDVKFFQGATIDSFNGPDSDPLEKENPSLILQEEDFFLVKENDLSSLRTSYGNAPLEEKNQIPNHQEHLYQNLRSLLSTVPTSLDDLIGSSGLSAALIRRVLMEWELEGVVERYGQMYILLEHHEEAKAFSPPNKDFFQ
jgi:DNA processing protein